MPTLYTGRMGEALSFFVLSFSMETIMKKYMVVFHGANRCDYYDTLEQVYDDIQRLATKCSIFECVLDDGGVTNWVQVRLYLATAIVSV
jgi:hypothetical protein